MIGLNRLQDTLDTPWKVWNGIVSWISLPMAHLLFFTNRISWGDNWRFYGLPIIQKHRKSYMHFGTGMRLRSSIRSNPLGVNRPVILATWQAGAVLDIGDNFRMTGGAICAAEKIIIKNNVLIGSNTTIIDTDFHPVDPEYRKLYPNQGKTSPITIEDDVFVGVNCLILKGVTIGMGSVVGAGAVVTKNIPPRVIVAGNPARIIGKIDNSPADESNTSSTS